MLARRFTALLMAVLTVWSFAPVTAQAASVSGTCGDNLNWTLENGVLTVTGTGPMGYTADIYPPWSSYRGEIISVILPRGMTSIEQNAFSGMIKLTHIVIPDTVESIGNNAFYYSGITDITIPASVKVIDYEAFRECESLGSVTMSEGLQSLGGGAFTDCYSLKTVNFPDSLKTVGQFPLAGTAYEGNEGNWKDGFLFAGNWIVNTRALPKNCVIPQGTVGLASNVMQGAQIESLSMADTVRELGESTFFGCSTLRELKLSANISDIRMYTFYGCSALESLNLPSGMRTIHREAFRDCTALKTVTSEEGLETLSQYAFYGCTALETVHLPATLKKTDYRPFSHCTALKDIYYADDRAHWEAVEKNGDVYDPAQTTLHYGKSTTLTGFCGTDGHEQEVMWIFDKGTLTVSGSGPMRNYPDFTVKPEEIKRVIIDEGVTAIGHDAFSHCVNLEAVQLPQSLRTIGDFAFEACRVLKTADIPSQVEELGSGAFNYCQSLESINVSRENMKYRSEDGVVFSKDGKTILLYPEGRANEVYTVPSGTESIAFGAFHMNQHIRALGVPLSVTHIDGGQISSCYFLSDIYYEGTKGQWSHMGGSAPQGINVHFGWKTGEPMAHKLVPYASDNINDQNYEKWSDTVKSHLVPMNDGTFMRVEATDKAVIAEYYDSQWNITDKKVVAIYSYELPIYGGFYSGEKYNFLVFGDNNPSESRTKVVVKAVKYSKDWQPLGAACINGANTAKPFYAGSLRMTEYGDYLYIHTCHEMFTTSDGVNHQANMMFNIHTPDMKLRDGLWGIESPRTSYMSHSFNQFVETDGHKLFTVGHGDASPRSIALFESHYPVGQDQLIGVSGGKEVFPIGGETGDNETDASVGGFVITDKAYIIAGNSTPQKWPPYENETQRNIFLSVMPKEGVSPMLPLETRFLTAYPESGLEVRTPQLVKVNGDRVVIMWNEADPLNGYSEFFYQILDGAGKAVSPVYSHNYIGQSDCQPVACGNKIFWYVTAGDKPVFYTLDLDNPENIGVSGHEHTYEAAGYRGNPCTESAFMTYVCEYCGDKYTKQEAPLGHKWVLEYEMPETSERCGYRHYNCERCGTWIEIVMPPEGMDENASKCEAAVEGSTAAESGAGFYYPSDTVYLHAGEREGFIFEGWTVTQGFADIYDPELPDTQLRMVEDNITVKANWRPESPVIFKSQGVGASETTVEAVNMTEASGRFMLILAAYDGDGRMLDIDAKVLSMAPGGKCRLAVNYSSRENVKTVKAMAFEEGSYTPMFSPKVFGR